MTSVTADGSSSARVDLYRTKTNTWTSAPDLPAAVNHSAAAALGGRFVVAGGYGANRSAWVLTGGRWRALPRLPLGGPTGPALALPPRRLRDARHCPTAWRAWVGCVAEAWQSGRMHSP